MSSDTLVQFQPLPPIENSDVMKEADISVCNMYDNPLKCPLWAYIIFIALFIGAAIFIIASFPESSNTGDDISYNQRWIAGISSILLSLIASFGFIWWMLKECKECRSLESWMIFIAAVISPIVIFFFSLTIFALLAGINLWSFF